MSPEALTSDRVYASLRPAIISGRYPPGSLLVANAIADEFGVSISPVRDVLQRMVGSRLLEAHPGGGFQIPAISEDGLRDLYIWHSQLLRLAVKSRDHAASAADPSTTLAALNPTDSPGVAAATAELFAGIATLSKNREHHAEIVAAGDRLHAVRIREVSLKNRVPELESLWAALVTGRESVIQKAIWTYHRRRLRQLKRLVSAMYAPTAAVLARQIRR